MEPDLILVERHGAIAKLVINNPPMNIVTVGLIRQFSTLLDQLAKDEGVRVVVLTGVGQRSFCAGSDVKEMHTITGRGAMVEQKLVNENRVYSQLDDFPKPTIAAIHGLALGGGLELAICCDLIVADEDAKLGLPEINLGWFPGSGGPARVTKRIGDARAKELMFFGDFIAPATALAWGLINRVSGKGEAVHVAMEMAERLAQKPNKALQACKRAIDIAADEPEDQAIAKALQLSDDVFDTNDAREGARAFFHKEKPAFTHS